ncbi:MAG: hypothetical protein ACK4IX_09965 [Candidatus Sericytochromatia bacterium]
MEILIKKVIRAFNLTSDLVNNLSDEQLVLTISDLPSNKIGEQFWCIIGARESYLRAIENSKWSGFTCSLKSINSKIEIKDCLDKSLNNTISFLKDNDLSEIQLDILLDLLEHEVQHHGQLIRYFYSNKLDFPKSWNDRYTV